jgi:ubiquinone/menaquinone biosynthesis C-methylase UbiE
VNSSPQFIDAFSDTAEHYAGSRPIYPQAFFRALAALAPGTEAAWDCGTGNGQAAIGLAEFFTSVQATDASSRQLAEARAHPRVQYRTATAEDCGLADKSVDLVSVAQALHWFDLARFFREVRRVARPDALIAVYGYTWFYITPSLDVLTELWLVKPIQPFWMANNRLLWNGYRTIDFPFEEIEAPNFAIHLWWTLDQLFDYYLTWSAPRRKIAADGDDFVTAARHALDAAWGDPTAQRHIVMPLSVRLGKVA